MTASNHYVFDYFPYTFISLHILLVAYFWTISFSFIPLFSAASIPDPAWSARWPWLQPRECDWVLPRSVGKKYNKYFDVGASYRWENEWSGWWWGTAGTTYLWISTSWVSVRRRERLRAKIRDDILGQNWHVMQEMCTWMMCWDGLKPWSLRRRASGWDVLMSFCGPCGVAQSESMQSQGAGTLCHLPDG